MTPSSQEMESPEIPGRFKVSKARVSKARVSKARVSKASAIKAAIESGVSHKELREAEEIQQKIAKLTELGNNARMTR